MVLDRESSPYTKAKTPRRWWPGLPQRPLQVPRIDMSDYRKAIRQVFAELHDPYHVVALANKASDLETGRKQLLKGTRFLCEGWKTSTSAPDLMQLMEISSIRPTSSRRRSATSGTSPTQRPAMPSWMPGSSRPAAATSSSPGSPAPFTGIAPACSTTSNSICADRSSKDEPMVSGDYFKTLLHPSGTSPFTGRTTFVGHGKWGGGDVVGTFRTGCSSRGQKTPSDRTGPASP